MTYVHSYMHLIHLKLGKTYTQLWLSLRNAAFIVSNVALVYETVMQWHIFLLVLSVNAGKLNVMKEMQRITYIGFTIEIES